MRSPDDLAAISHGEADREHRVLDGDSSIYPVTAGKCHSCALGRARPPEALPTSSRWISRVTDLAVPNPVLHPRTSESPLFVADSSDARGTRTIRAIGGWR